MRRLSFILATVLPIVNTFAAGVSFSNQAAAKIVKLGTGEAEAATVRQVATVVFKLDPDHISSRKTTARLSGNVVAPTLDRTLRAALGGLVTPASLRTSVAARRGAFPADGQESWDATNARKTLTMSKETLLQKELTGIGTNSESTRVSSASYQRALQSKDRQLGPVHAQQLSCSGSLPLNGSVSGGTQTTDIYCIDIPYEGILTLTLTSTARRVYVFDFQGVNTSFKSWPDDLLLKTSGTASIALGPALGQTRFFVQVDGNGAYGLSSSFSDLLYPNDTETYQNPYDPIIIGTTVTGDLGTIFNCSGSCVNSGADLNDHFEIVAGAPGTLTITAQAASPSLQLYYLTLSGSAGQIAKTQSIGSSLTVTANITAGTFHIDLACIAGSFGGYQLSTSLQAGTPSPIASFVFSPPSPKVGQLVQFSDQSTESPTSWLWSFGDGASSTIRNPSHTYATAGTYHVTLTATNTGGSNNVTNDVTVTALPPPPVAQFTYSPVSPVAGQPVSFADATTLNPTTWSWSFGDNASSTQQNPTHAYTSAGTFTVLLTAGNANGSSSTSKTVNILPAGPTPVANFTYSPASPKPGQPITFTDTSSGTPTSWSWAFGDVGAASTPTTPHTFATAGTFTVALVVTNAFGANSTSKQVTVQADVPALTADFAYSPTNPTAGTPVQFTDHSAGNSSSWLWDFGDQATSIDRNPSHTFGAAGSYRVALTAQDATTQDTATKTVTVSAAACTSGCITLSGNTRVLGIHRAGVAVQVAAANSLEVRLIDIHGQPTSYVAKVALDGSYTLTAPSASYSIVCDITYNDNVLQPATGAYLQVTRHAVQTKPVPSAPSNAIVDFVFPSPLVFLHGIRSDQTKWNSWTAGLGGSSPSRPDAIFFTPAYDYLADYGTEAYSVDLQLTYDFKLFAAVPEFNVVAHSKGGVVARVVRGTTSTGAGIVNAVLLGTPNDGAECFTIPALIERYFPATQQLDPGYYHLSRCDLQTLNADSRTGSWGSVNVLAIAGTKNLQTRATLDLWGGCINGPNDTFVPIESVFKMTFTAGNTPISTMLNGIVTPYTHLELGDDATLWMLNAIVFPFFGGTFSAHCPYAYATPSASCAAPFPVDDALCYDGRGLTTSGCNLAARDRTLFGVTLTWSSPITSFASPTAPSAAAGSFTGCGDVIQYAMVRAEASAGVGVVGFQIYRSTSPITTVKPSLLIGYASGDQLSFIDSNPATGTSYYAVTALYDSGESAPAQAAPVILTGKHRAVSH